MEVAEAVVTTGAMMVIWELTTRTPRKAIWEGTITTSQDLNRTISIKMGIVITPACLVHITVQTLPVDTTKVATVIMKVRLISHIRDPR